MSDFLDWPLPRQEAVVREVCGILDKNYIPYVYKRMNRPARSLTCVQNRLSLLRHNSTQKHKETLSTGMSKSGKVAKLAQ